MNFIEKESDLYQRDTKSFARSWEAYTEIEKEVIQKWNPDSEVHVLKYGKLYLMSLGVIPAWQCLSKGRNILKMYQHSRYMFPIMASSVLASSLFTVLTQTYNVKKDILLAETPCSVCVSSRAGAMQVATGVFIPSFFATTHLAMFGRSQGFLKDRNYKGFGTTFLFKWTFKHLYNCRSILVFNAAFQLAVNYFFVTKMYSEWFHVNDVLENAIKRENELKRQKENSQDYLF